MSDSNIGSRKDRNIRNHLFMIYGIINSVVKGNEDCIDIQIYDIEKAFDGLWLEDCMNDVFDSISEKNKNDNPSTRQPVNQSTRQPVNPSTCQPVNLSECQPVNLSTCQHVNLSTCQPVNLSTCQPVNLSTLG